MLDALDCGNNIEFAGRGKRFQWPEKDRHLRQNGPRFNLVCKDINRRTLDPAQELASVWRVRK